MGASATLASNGFGLTGVRATVTLPMDFAARGVDSRNYFDAYLGFFMDDPENSFLEAGIAFYGEIHIDKGKSGAAIFRNHWQTTFIPVDGGDGVQADTYKGGLNVKACIGYNNADKTVHFTGMAVRIDQVRTAKGWTAAGGFILKKGLLVAPRS
jgi:hypothetical protein